MCMSGSYDVKVDIHKVEGKRSSVFGDAKRWFPGAEAISSAATATIATSNNQTPGASEEKTNIAGAVQQQNADVNPAGHKKRHMSKGKIVLLVS